VSALTSHQDQRIAWIDAEGVEGRAAGPSSRLGQVKFGGHGLVPGAAVSQSISVILALPIHVVQKNIFSFVS
jgi:hypothetical protein